MATFEEKSRESEGNDKNSETSVVTIKINRRRISDETQDVIQLPEEENRTEDRRTDKLLRPPDGGWGWLVTFGGFINTVLSHMIGPCFALIFSRFLLDLKTSSTTVSWIFNLQNAMFNITGILVGPLSQEFGWRRVIFVGALFESLSLITSAFAPSAEFLFFSYSLLSGIGSGATVCTSMLAVPKFFDKRRGRANSILMAGFCIGGMIGPPIFMYLQSEFGFVGATLITGAILLNGCVAACLFQPVEWHQKSNLGKRRLHHKGHVASPAEKSHRTENYDKEAMESKMISNLDNDASVNNSLLLPSPVLGSESRVSEVPNILGRLTRTTINNLKLLRSPSVLILSLENTLFITGYINFIMMVPFAMQATGHTLESSAWCISIAAVCNLLTRTAANSLSDFKWFNIKIFYVFGLATVAACNFSFPLVSNLQWQMAIMGLWGSGVGATMGVYGLIMIEIIGIEKMSACFGSSCLLIATGYITLGPLMGYVRDVSESYAVSMWVSSSLVALSFLLWLMMPLALAYDRRKEKEKTTQS